MPWFQKLCRQTGLLIHDVVHAGEKRRVVRKQVEQNQPQEQVTLRRTTIEEIEIKEAHPPAPRGPAADRQPPNPPPHP